MQGVHFTQEERRRALRRADEIGIQAAAAETGVSISLLYAWRRNARTFAPARVCDETKGLKKSKPIRIDDDMRRRVVAIYNAGRSQRQISELLGISQAEISRIIRAARFAAADDDGAVQVSDAAPETSNNTSIDDLRKSIDDLKTAVEIAIETLLDVSEKNNESNPKNTENIVRN